MSLIDDLKKSLNPEQFEAATFMAGPAVIMAGAGSGKTHTLMSRVAFLIDSGVNPENIAMLTFTNAAADEMKVRSTRLLDERCKKILACTYHKFCNQMLRQYGRVMHINDYSILSSNETKNMIDYVKSSDPMFDNLKNFPSSKTVASIMSLSINKQLSVADIVTKIDKYTDYEDYANEIEILINEVSNYGWRNQKFTYDDLLVYMNKLLDDDDVCKRIATRYQYIMVDEFQDTNNLQESIILKIAKFNNNIVVVGDISQSIYGFRGANVRNLQHFNQKLKFCKTIVLNSNYRSTQEILNAANDVMRHNVKSWTYYDMKAVGKSGPKPKIRLCQDNYHEISDVIHLIEKFHTNGIPYKDIAILERGSMSSFGIEQELLLQNIKFNKMGGMKFMDYDCVGDMLAYFKVLTNPYDLLSWFRILQLHPYIGKVYAKKVADGCENSDFLVNNIYTKRKFYQELLLLHQNYNLWKNHVDVKSIFETIEKFYFNVRVRAIDESRMSDENKEDAKQSVETDRIVLKQLELLALQYSSIVEFLDDIVLDSLNNIEFGDDVLTISTIHSAKGLEWKVVIILDCIEGVFPARITPDKYWSEEDEEELRCFYVAMTRAKRHLILMVPKYRMSYDRTFDKCELSHYLMHAQKEFDFI